MQKQIGKYMHDICDKCGYDITKNYDRVFKFRGTEICFDYFKPIRENLTTPYYQNHIPSFVDGGTYEIFEFTSDIELCEHVISRIYDGDVLVQSDEGNYLMTQNINKRHWWVLGIINNFKSNLPKFNRNIYNQDESVNQEKLKKWLESM